MPDHSSEELKKLENLVLSRLAVWLRANGWLRIPPELYAVVHTGCTEAFLLGWQHKAPGPWEDEVTTEYVRPPADLPQTEG
jgi:hypothetical protein